MSHQILRVRHNWSEEADFFLSRPNGTSEWLFLHFKTPVRFSLTNQPAVLLAPDTCILLAPFTAHAFAPESGRLLHNWMHFFPQDPAVFSSLGITPNCFFIPPEPQMLTECIRRIERELTQKRPFYERALDAAAEEFLVMLARAFYKENTLTAPPEHRFDLEELRLHLYRHPEQYQNTAQMAKAVHLSRSRFSVLYHAVFHTTPGQDLIRARLDRACYYLSSDVRTVSEIAELCGYQNAYHFIRQFKTYQGMTPGAYQKKAKTASLQ